MSSSMATTPLPELVGQTRAACVFFSAVLQCTFKHGFVNNFLSIRDMAIYFHFSLSKRTFEEIHDVTTGQNSVLH